MSGEDEFVSPVEKAWGERGSFRMEVWMTGATALNLLLLPDGEHLVSGESDGTVRVLDEKTRGPTTVVNGAHKGGVTGMSCCTSSSSSSSSSSSLLSSGGEGQGTVCMFATGGGSDGTIKLWRSTSSSSQKGASSGGGGGGGGGGGDSFAVCHTVRTETSVERHGPAPCREISLSGCSGGSRIAACGGGAGHSVLVYDVVGMSGKATLVLLFRADGHVAPPCDIQAGRCFLEGSSEHDHGDSGGDFAVSADSDGCFRTWSIASRSCVRSVARQGRSPITSLHVCFPSQSLLLGTKDGSLELWHMSQGYELIPAVARHRGGVAWARIAGRAHNVAITGGDDVENSSGQKECVRFTDLSSGRALSSFTTAAVTCLAVRRGDMYAVSGHKDGKAYLWDVDSQCAAHVLDGHHSAVRSISIDRCCAVTGGEDSTCRNWRFADESVLGREREELDKRGRKAQEANDQGGLAYKKGRVNAAAKHYGLAVSLSRAEGGEPLVKYLCNRAAARLEGGDIQGSIDDSDEALALAMCMPEHSEARTKWGCKALGRKGVALAKMGGRKKAAIGCIEEALEMGGSNERLEMELAGLKGEDSAQNLRARAADSAAQGDLSTALEFMTLSVAVFPNDPRGYAGRAAFLLPLGQLDECIQDCEKALSILDGGGGGGDSAEGLEGEERALLRGALLARVGEARQEQGDLQGAEDAFTKSLEAYHDDEVLAGLNAVLELRREPHEKARREQEARVAAAAIDKEKGIELFRARKYTKAVDLFSAALEKDPSNPVYLMNRGVALSETGRITMAAKDFDQCVEAARGKGDAELASKALAKKGRMYERLAASCKDGSMVGGERGRHLEEARRAFEEGGEGGGCPEGLKRVADRVKEGRELDRAKEDVANGDRMFQDEQFAAAVKFYDKAEKSDPRGLLDGAYLLYANRGACLLQLERPRGALKDAVKCTEMNPGWASGHVLLARVHEVMENWGDMMACLLTAYDIEPENETCLRMIRDCMVQILLMQKEGKPLPKMSKGGSFHRAREDPEMKIILENHKIKRVIQQMGVSKDLKPLIEAMDADLPFCGLFAKLYSSGLLVGGPGS